MYQRPFQKIKPQTTAHLAQTMTLLYMNFGELDQEINKALNENPALIVGDEIHCQKCGHILQPGQNCPTCTNKAGEAGDDLVIFLSQPEDFFSREPQNDDDLYSEELFGHQETQLDEYILSQIAPDLREDEKTIAIYILNQLDEDGFFLEDIRDIANYYHVPLEKVERVKRIIQHADPLGAGSASPEEAINIQLNALKETGSIPEFYISIAEKYMYEILKKNFKVISKDMGLPIDEIEKAADFFSRNLNPYPARAHWGTYRQPPKEDHFTFSHPDVIIRNTDEGNSQRLIVEIMIPGNSTLEVNPLYIEALRTASNEVKDNLKNDLEKAQLFIKCLQQRNNTMEKLISKLVSIQKDFILKGEKHLKPVTRVEVSKILKVHESTISRAVANKSVQLPDGRIIPLASFFDRSMSIRSLVKELIQNEDKSSPLSDAALAKMLEDRGYPIARRTVTKYRAMEGIVPAYLRKLNQ